MSKLNMNKLRNMVREVLKEQEEDPGAVGAKQSVVKQFDKISTTAPVKMLKRALSQGGPDQRASGIYKILLSLTDNDPIVLMKIRQRLAGKKRQASPAPEQPTAEE